MCEIVVISGRWMPNYWKQKNGSDEKFVLDTIFVARIREVTDYGKQNVFFLFLNG